MSSTLRLNVIPGPTARRIVFSSDGITVGFAERAIKLGPTEYDVFEPLMPEGIEEPIDLASADLDQNGQLDLVVADRGAGGALFACLSGASGGLSCDVIFRGVSGAGQVEALPRALAPGDLDGDGLADIISAEDGGAPRLAVYLQDAPARFSQAAV